MHSVLAVGLVLSAVATATELLDRNLAYTTPFKGIKEFAHDTRAIQARHIRNVRRQVVDNDFSDEHYPTFYGADFSNSPFVWNGGINFTHSVASGDPFDTSVLLWTRAVPVAGGGSSGPDQSVPVCVSFKIFDNSKLSGKPIDSGEAFTSYDVHQQIVQATEATDRRLQMLSDKIRELSER